MINNLLILFNQGITDEKNVTFPIYDYGELSSDGLTRSYCWF
ncbi:hypothetical protein VAE122_2730003 [Vibrio aestuarianus]|nr:hypothetical protein VAE122_2730003 [Vibrio aestuarianus]